MTRLADRAVRDRRCATACCSASGRSRRLPEVVAAAGGSRVFVVTDPGVVAIGRHRPGRRACSRRRAVESAVFAEVEPNPGASTVERGAAALRDVRARRHGRRAGRRRLVDGHGQGASTCTRRNAVPVWELEYDGPDLAPGPAGHRRPDDRRDRRRDEHVRRHHRRDGRAQGLRRPSHRCCRVATILDPALTVGLPPAATAATGIDAMTHSLESLLSANPNPFAEAMALGVIRTVGEWLPRAVADGSDLEARSQMLMASHLAGVGQASGTGVGLVHALGHAIGTRGRVGPRHGPRGRAIRRCSRSTSATARSRAGAGRGRARRRVAAESRGDRRPPSPSVPSTGSCATSASARPCASLGLDDAALDSSSPQDALDDAAIRNSPRLPTRDRGPGHPRGSSRLRAGL